MSNVCPNDTVKLRAAFCFLPPVSALRGEGVWNFQRSQQREEMEVKKLLFCPREWPAEGDLLQGNSGAKSIGIKKVG